MHRVVIVFTLSCFSMTAFADAPFNKVSVCKAVGNPYGVFKVETLGGDNTEMGWAGPPKKGATRTRCQKVPHIHAVRVCTTVPNGRVSEQNPYTVTIKANGKTTLTWHGSNLNWGNVGNIYVGSFKLGGNNRDAGAIDILNNVESGMGIGYSTLYIITNSGKSIAGPIKLQDYGIISGFYRVAGKQGCVLLASKWKEGSEPKHGEGMYAVGHWYSLSHGVLAPYSKLPSMRRRLLYSFQSQLEQNHSTPMLWFKNKSTEILAPTKHVTQ